MDTGHASRAASHTSREQHASHADHTGHEQMFRRRFWLSLALSIPVLVFSPMIQDLLGFRLPPFAGSEWIPFIFSVVIFAYGGMPFLRLAVPEIRSREPGMMTLISLAISVALVYSLAAQLLGLGEGFFWELVTLIDIISSDTGSRCAACSRHPALNELAPHADTAELLLADGNAHCCCRFPRCGPGAAGNRHSGGRSGFRRRIQRQ
jgi:Cu2+-exporting ATPase